MTEAVAIPVLVPGGGDTEALVDPRDVERATCCTWYLDGRYARGRPSGRRLVLMHRFIVGAPVGVEVDHRNGRTLDNRRENLRSTTHAQNGQNLDLNANNTSGFRGVTWNRQRGRWQAQVMLEGRNHYLGLFDTAETASAAASAFRRRRMPYSERGHDRA